ncbi:MAG: hypothetical protein DRH08_13265 [Deltaproteobacteria bacterium]|nr:MAG: hypothetical protein DRH08_13265 [Deltaproteobacteria bacterium]
MMPVPEQGFQIDPEVLIQTQTNFIAQARTKEVQMEAAIQQLMAENGELKARIAELKEDLNPSVEVEEQE